MAIPIDDCKLAIKRFVADYPVATKLAFKIRETAQDFLADLNQGAVPERLSEISGGYVVKPFLLNDQRYEGYLLLVLENLENNRSLLLTLRHEVLGHYALNTFRPDEKNKVLAAILKTENEPGLAEHWAHVNTKYAEASQLLKAEEIFARVAETIAPIHHIGNEAHAKGIDVFNKFCADSAKTTPMSLNDVRSLVLMTAQGIHDRSRAQQTFFEDGFKYAKAGGADAPAVSKKDAFNKEFTDKLIKQLEEGRAPWQIPWEKPQPVMPFNCVSENDYHGGNVMRLLAQRELDPRWMTYKQAQENGFQVRKGEKGTQIAYWQSLKTDEGKEKAAPTGEGDDKKGFAFLKVFTVFNASQIDGMPPYEQAITNPVVLNERCLDFIKAMGAEIREHGKAAAYYDLRNDVIKMPPQQNFPDQDRYYACVVHELAHWTSHKDRLDRPITGNKLAKEYAIEELRAEIASMMVGAKLGLKHDPSSHVTYVESWLEALNSDHNVLAKVCADADKITNYLFEREKAFYALNPKMTQEVRETVLFSQAKIEQGGQVLAQAEVYSPEAKARQDAKMADAVEMAKLVLAKKAAMISR